MGVPVTCKICNKIFLVKPYRSTTAICCSRQCQWHFTKHKREPKRIEKISGKTAHNSAKKKMKCVQCREYFKISPSRIGKKWFCSKSCYSENCRKEKKKYTFIQINGEKVLMHRHIMEVHLRRKLLTTEHVHHIDGDPSNNSLENLIVLDIKEHGKITAKEKFH